MYTLQTTATSATERVGSRVTRRALIVLCLIFTGTGHAADSNRAIRDTVFYGTPPSAEEIGKHLFPTENREPLSRSITFTQSQEPAVYEQSVSMPILFHFGKTTVVEASRPFLDSIGQMLLKAEYADKTLIVEGHTDAVGSASSNQRLSELRALAIKDYLVTRYSIDPYRLFPTGQGESMLVKPEAPTDGVNRRVEFLPYTPK